MSWAHQASGYTALRSEKTQIGNWLSTRRLQNAVLSDTFLRIVCLVAYLRYLCIAQGRAFFQLFYSFKFYVRCVTCGWGSPFLVWFLPMDVHFSSTICWKDCPFSIDLPLHLYAKSIDHIFVCVYNWTICSSIDLFVYLSPILQCLDKYIFTVNQVVWVLQLYSFFPKLVWLF